MSSVELNKRLWSQMGYSPRSGDRIDQGAIDLDGNYVDVYNNARPIDMDGGSIVAYYGFAAAIFAAVVVAGHFFA